ncbi:hypothetical protein FPV67DRAFT_1206050 [Lyophyllum atratum]|nr:hypothetical protein FPV67DRAFT_1206050 [Lyophyllum atratum]
MASPPLPPEVAHALASGFSHLVANKYYVLASTVMLLYDHLLTLERERRYIWAKPKRLPTYLFFIWRYATPIVSLLNIVAEHDPTWIGPRCSRWIWLPVAIGPIVSAATGVILILRVHAIYAKAKWVLYVTIPIYLGQLAVMGWSIPSGVPAPLPPGFVGCVPSEKLGTGNRLSGIYIAALAFDATIFFLTFGRAIYMRIVDTSLPLLDLIVRDGTAYFAVLFVVNLTNVILLSVAPPDLSAINAPFATLITALLVSRLVMNLREAGERMSMGPSAFSVESSMQWLPAARGDGDLSRSQTTGGQTSTAIPSTMSSRNHSKPAAKYGIGTMTFQDIIGVAEFDVPLGEEFYHGYDYSENEEDNMELRRRGDGAGQSES